MKIAVASSNGETVGQHFGRARSFVVLTIEDGTVTGREIRDSHNVHDAPESEGRGHGDCFEVAAAITDCRALIVGGMGMGAYEKFRRAGIEPVLTDERSVDEAGARYSRGELPHLPERLHVGGRNDRTG